MLTATPQYFAVAEWNETSRDVVYTELYGSRLYLWIWCGGHLLQMQYERRRARQCRLLCIPVDRFFDDKNLLVFEQHAGSVMDVAKRLMAAIGWPIKDLKTKPMARAEERKEHAHQEGARSSAKSTFISKEHAAPKGGLS